MLPARPAAVVVPLCGTCLLLITTILAALLISRGPTKYETATLETSLLHPLSEVSWSPEQSGVFLGSPSLLVMPGGSLLASYDEFGPGEWAPNATIYASEDGGKTWLFRSRAPQQYWSNLFLHKEEVFLLGTTCDTDAGIAISRSVDVGHTWEHQVLWRWPGAEVGSYATGATPVVKGNGRLWRCVELWHSPSRWPQDFQAVVLSVGVDEDLLNPLAWTMSEALPYNASWLPPFLNATTAPISGFLEGNMLIGPEGDLQVLMRTSMQNLQKQFMDLNHATLLTFQPSLEPALPQTYQEHRRSPPAVQTARSSPVIAATTSEGMYHVQPKTNRHNSTNHDRPHKSRDLPLSSPPGPPQQYRRGRRLRVVAGGMVYSGAGRLAYNATVAMPGGGNKFVVRFDSATQMYVSFTNPGTANYGGYDQRNVLTLSVSSDLRVWRQIQVVLIDDTGFIWIDSLRYTGFDYVDWQFLGDDLVGLVRTAYRGANSYHNSNRITFLRVPAWRQHLYNVPNTSYELGSLGKEVANSTSAGGSCHCNATN